MDSYEATRVVFSRLQSLDPDTASKTMGYILLHDAADDLLPRLALGPDSLLRDISLQAKSLLPDLTPQSPPSYATVLNNTSADAGDDPYGNLPPSFLDDPPASDLLLPLHRRSLSVPAGGGGTCHYYARGFCKNGSSCRFFHTELLPGGGRGGDMVPGLIGSPRPSPDHCGDGFVKPRAATNPSVYPKQYSLAVATANGNSNGSLPYNKCFNFLLQHQTDFHPRSGSFGLNGLVNPSARQIYLTFPADSTFTEEDVSNYFSIYGPVQDVRIPYQQKRMFGFVTFLYSETVKLILAKGNPHFVCDSRVLVKPYKEKGKVVEKKHLQLQQLQLERGEYSISPCSSPSGIESRDPFDVPFGGGRMHYGNQEMLLRKLEEEADYNFRQALELQNRRLMNLHLQDLKNHQHHHHHHHYSHPHRHHHDLSNGSPLSSPTVPRSPNFQFHNHLQPDSISLEIPESDKGSRNLVESNPRSDDNNGGDDKEETSKLSMESDHNESLEHILPDNLFGSPRKSATDHPTMVAASYPDANENPASLDMPMLPSSSAFSALPAKSPALAMESTMNSVSP